MTCTRSGRQAERPEAGQDPHTEMGRGRLELLELLALLALVLLAFVLFCASGTCRLAGGNATKDRNAVESEPPSVATPQKTCSHSVERARGGARNAPRPHETNFVAGRKQQRHRERKKSCVGCVKRILPLDPRRPIYSPDPTGFPPGGRCESNSRLALKKKKGERKKECLIGIRGSVSLCI